MGKKIKIIKLKKRIIGEEFLLWLSQLRTRHSVREDVGSVPGLAQCVKDPELPQAAAQVTGVLGSDVAVAVV